MSNTRPVSQSDILWRAHPWVVPAFAGTTLIFVVIAVLAAWAELVSKNAFLRVGPVPLLFLTLGVLGVIWLIASLRLAIQRATQVYILRGSSVEVEDGIVQKKTFTLSAGGFSELEVVRSLSGRILNMGDIIVVSDSGKRVVMRKVRDPVGVEARIRAVMAVPQVRFGAPPAADTAADTSTKGNGKRQQ